MQLKELGDYVIVKELGTGALGTTYLAEHQFLKRPFVIKVFSEEVSRHPQFINRFKERVAALSSLDHPHIVKLHNVSMHDDLYFLVSEHKHAVNLTQYLASVKGQISEEKLSAITEQIASALDYVHDKMIGDKPLAHMGLKPGNVLVQEEKGDIQVYLSDFGVAEIVGMGTLLEHNLRAATARLNHISKSQQPELNLEIVPEFSVATLKNGWEHFSCIAPEWLAGHEKIALSDKTDVYAFGALLYYIMMREFPHGVFDFPSKRYPKYVKNWDFVISSCLQNQPGRRPENLKKLLKDCIAKPREEVAIKSPHANVWKASAQGGGAMPANSPPSDLFSHVSDALCSSTRSAASNTVSVMKKAESATAVKTAPTPVLKPCEIKRPKYDEDPSAAFQTDSTVVKFRPKETVIIDSKPLLTDMAVIPSGEYKRGSNSGGRDEMPRHKVALSSFAIDIHAVTNEQFVRFLEAMGGEKDSNNLDIINLRDSRIKRLEGKLNIESGYAKHPVVGVSWYGAVAYAKWVGKRLPTEAEWEIASSGGSDLNSYPTGDAIERNQANYFSSDTTTVMSYPANDYGLYDMSGNVYEWCQDWYEYNAYEHAVQEPDNPLGPKQGVYRVLRGGCWKSLKDDLRSSHRHRNNPRTMNATYGFRCAADVEE